MFHFSFPNWLNPVTRKSRASRRRSFLPQLEALEDRLAPAVLIVNTSTDEATADDFLSLRQAVNVVNTQSESGLSGPEQNQISGPLGSNDTIQFDPSLMARRSRLPAASCRSPTP
jgi:hypothetical protein